MNFDKRIKSEKIIFNYLNRVEANNYVGTYGYFADELDEFKDLTKVTASILYEIKNIEGCFYCDEAIGGFRYFIPEDLLADKAISLAPKYRPYTLDEFIRAFDMGDVFTIRSKHTNYTAVISYNGYSKSSLGTCIHLGADKFTLDELFKRYEIGEGCGPDETWHPFGIEDF